MDRISKTREKRCGKGAKTYDCRLQVGDLKLARINSKIGASQRLSGFRNMVKTSLVPSLF